MWHNSGLRFFRPNREAFPPTTPRNTCIFYLGNFKSEGNKGYPGYPMTLSWTNCWISPKSSSVTSAADDKVNRWPLLRNARCLSTKNVMWFKSPQKTSHWLLKWHTHITWPYYIYIRQDSFFCKPFLRIQDPNKTTTGKTGMDRPCIDFFCQSILQSQTVWKCLKCQDTFAGFL